MNHLIYEPCSMIIWESTDNAKVSIYRIAWSMLEDIKTNIGIFLGYFPQKYITSVDLINKLACNKSDIKIKLTDVEFNRLRSLISLEIDRQYKDAMKHLEHLDIRVTFPSIGAYNYSVNMLKENVGNVKKLVQFLLSIKSSEIA